MRLKSLRTSPTLLLLNIAQLVALQSNTNGPRRGRDLGELGLIEDGAVLSVGGKIVSVGKTKDALRDSWIRKNRRKIREARDSVRALQRAYARRARVWKSGAAAI